MGFWLRVKFWLLGGAAFLAVFYGIAWVVTATEWWGGPVQCFDGAGCYVPPPALSPVPALAFGVGLAVFVCFAARVRRRAQSAWPLL